MAFTHSRISRNDAQTAVARITIPPTITQTGFLISAQGLVATAGHGFVKSKCSIGDRFELEFLKGPKVHAILKEFVLNPDKGLDYAILGLVENQPSIRPIPINTRASEIHGKSGIIFGYRAGLLDTLTSAEGKVKGNAPIRNSAATRIEFSTEPGLLNGLSGGPLCAAGTYVAYGIQSFQMIASPSTCFVTPFEVVRKHSPLLNRMVNTPPVDLDAAHMVEYTGQGAPIERSCLFLLPLPISTDFDKRLWMEIGARWDDFDVAFQERCQRVAWLPRRPHRPTIKLQKLHLNIQAPPISLTEMVSHATLPYGGTALRTVADMSGCVLSLNSETTPGVLDRSHLVGITLERSDCILPADTTFDHRIGVGRESPEKTAVKILNVIEDVLFDLYAFNSMPGLKQIFGCLSARRDFSLEKVAFARAVQLRPYGWAGLESAAVRYISLGSCSRTRMNAAVNEAQLEDLWRRMLADFVFPTPSSGAIDKVPMPILDNMVHHVRSLPKLSGQLSEKRLRRMLDNARLPARGVAALVVAVRRPHRHTTRDTMATVFGHEKWHNKMFVILVPCNAYNFG